jgi:UDP-N-acetylglucosamine 2-epimerase (non-hydrolysing)
MSDDQYLSQELLQKIKEDKRSNIHIVVMGTKPDIIKQAPIYHELKKQNELVVICHTGQHYDFRYSGGMEKEFGIEIGINLRVEGSLHQFIAQMIERFGLIIQQLQEAGKTPIPYIHGDTTTAMAIGLSSYFNRVACVHVEAGIRTLTPKKEIYEKFFQDFKNGQFDWSQYYVAMKDKNNFERGSMEPFPEQFNTRAAEPASGLHAAAVDIIGDFLIDEGFPPDRVVVTGNTVADATVSAIADSQNSTIFEKYPQLKGGNFIRYCIHRRENTQDKKRFTILIESMEKLIKEGKNILFISLFGTESAIDNFGLRDKINALVKDYPDNFIYSDVWPYYRDVIAAMRECAAVATDSGSMQEEMNILGIPCVTLRFGSDRGESIIAGGNVLAPPIDSDFIVEIVKGAINNQEMKSIGNIYGENVSEKIVESVLNILNKGKRMFQTEEERLGL